MKVRALKSFVANMPNGHKYRAEIGDVLEMPSGADWLTAGLVEAVVLDPKPESKSVNRSPRRQQADD